MRGDSNKTFVYAWGGTERKGSQEVSVRQESPDYRPRPRRNDDRRPPKIRQPNPSYQFSRSEVSDGVEYLSLVTNHTGTQP